MPSSDAAVNASVSRVNASTIQFTYHDLDASEGDFGPSIPTWLHELGVRVEHAEGFRIDRTENSASLIWNTSVKVPTVMLTTIDRRRSDGFDEAGAAIQPTWAFFPIPDHSHPTNVSLDGDTPGYIGDQVILLGEYSSYRRSVGCHTLELYIPDTLDTVEPPTEIVDSLEAAARRLDVGGRYETVRVFGVGRPVRDGGRAFTHEVWVNVNSSFEPQRDRGWRSPPRQDPVNVWLHEYVHTRQRWATNGSATVEASWLTEGIASYYMVAETERQGRMQAYDEMLYWSRLNKSLRFGSHQMVLTDRSTYREVDGDYTRGAYVLAALDAEVRAQTGGTRSLDDVFYRLNQQDEVNHTTFRQAVVEVGGEEMGPWVDRYVAGTAVPPEPPIPLEVYVERLPYERELQVAAAMLGIVVVGSVALVVYHLKRGADSG